MFTSFNLEIFNWLSLAVAFVLTLPFPTHAQGMKEAAHSNLKVIQAILEMPEDKIDLTRAKLTIDKMIDPSIDVEANIAKIDAIAEQIKRTLPADTSAWDKMLALRQFFYIAGPWNDNRPWHYNFDHPRGEDLSDTLLPNYLESRKGQCVSMPLLYLSIAQRINMNVALAVAPKHSLVMLKGDDGNWLNLETTADGAPTRLSTYQRQSPMSQSALDNGAYMRPLTKHEAVADLTSELIQFYQDNGRPEQAAELAELGLQFFPNDIGLWLYKGNAYHDIIRRDFMAKYPTSKDIPTDLYLRFNELADKTVTARRRAFELGFMPETDADENNYADKVSKAKSAFGAAAK